MPAVPVSVVIICFNAAATIQQTLASAYLLSDDVIVVDSGSTDSTLALVQTTGAKLLHADWQGFGINKNKGNKEAKNDWILSIDADEELSEKLIAAISSADLSNNNVVYRVERINYLSDKRIYFGEWRNDWTTRLFNRNSVCWDDARVHETLILPQSVQVKKLPGYLHHYTSPNIDAYNQKLDKYASLVAEKYFTKGEKGIGYKIYFSPLFSFCKYYIFHAGWLDKKAGWQIAIAHAKYTFKKYKKVAELRYEYKSKQNKKPAL
jgi:glycosyltransferase involved in cell wall biosynthesis